MHYTLKKPCDNCPFRRQGGIRLHPARARQIAAGMLDSQGTEFACHKTTVDDEAGDRIATKDSQHCAGALIFAEKNHRATQMMRITERFGDYDPRALDKASVSKVFDDIDEMVECSKRSEKCRL